MPVVDSNTTDEQITRMRAVRIGRFVYYSESVHDIHAKIAVDNGATEYTNENRPRPIVDDAGFLRIENGIIVMKEDSTSTFIKVAENARGITNSILAGINRERV